MAKGPWTNISRGQLDNAFLNDKGTYFSPRNSSEVNLSYIYTHTRAHKYVFTRVFLASVFLTMKNSKSLKYPSIRDWVNTQCHIHVLGYCAALGKKPMCIQLCWHGKVSTCVVKWNKWKCETPQVKSAFPSYTHGFLEISMQYITCMFMKSF